MPYDNDNNNSSNDNIHHHRQPDVVTGVTSPFHNSLALLNVLTLFTM